MSLLDILPTAKSRHHRKLEALTYHYDNEKPHDSAGQLRTTLRAFDEFALQTERFENSAQVATWLVEDINNDALLLARTIIPNDEADKLELPSSLPTSPSREPALEDIYLLAKAYDITKNDATKLSLEYVLFDNPPGLHEFLEAAYKRSRKNNTPIMDEYSSIDKNFTHASHLPIEECA